MRFLLKLIGLGLNILSFIAPQNAAKRALTLFTNPPKARVRAKEQAFLDTASMVKFRDTVRYTWGDPTAPYILLSYGWAYNAGRWRHFVPSLVEAGYRVVAYDPPGHGHAPKGTLTLPANAEIIKGIIHELGKPAAIIGHSFGGSASVLALNSLPPSLHPSRFAIMASFSNAEGVFRDFQSRLGMREGLYQDYVRYTEQLIGDSICNFDLGRMTGRMEHIRALIIHDPKDDTTGFKNAEYYLHFWKNSLLLAPQHAGHHLGTSEVTEAVCAFVANGIAPKDSVTAEAHLPADHDLTRYFAGV
ncbi:MAG: alpha/beta fold hydrolase [Bacteroidia bacterium]